MAALILPHTPDVGEKLDMMREDARFEVGCDNDAESTAISCASDIHGKPAPPKVPKLYFCGSCVFNCSYCGCRCSREKSSDYCTTPDELAKMAVGEALKNGHGVFISSAICKNADYTQENLAECVRLMRERYGYGGYVHAKVMPGADPLLIERTGKYANRLSVNIEVAQSSGYSHIAKQKNRSNILTPMGSVAEQIAAAKYDKRRFAVSQTTQLMAGSTDEDDRTILRLTTALYKKYSLKRVYYTAYTHKYESIGYEEENLQIKQTPYWRMARLYQADRLTQLYGFGFDEITPDADPFLHEDVDPKAGWALRNLSLFPIEVNTADYETLLRIPGIGVTAARRIIEIRRHCAVTLDILRKIRVPVRRTAFFITCSGKYIGGSTLDSPFLRRAVTSNPYEQLTLF